MEDCRSIVKQILKIENKSSVIRYVPGAMSRMLMVNLIVILLLPATVLAQSEFYIYVQDALGHSLPNAKVHVEQGGVSLPVQTNPVYYGYFTVQVAPNVPLKVSADLKGYFIHPLEVANPNRVENIAILSAGQSGDSLMYLGGRPVYFRAYPQLIGFYPSQKWNLMQQQGKLKAWEEKLGLKRSDVNPWPVDPRAPKSFGAITPNPVFYERADGKPFPLHHVAQLDSIRSSGMGLDAGVTLGPYVFLTHTFCAFNCTAPPEWLAKNKLTVIPDPANQGRTFLIEGPRGLGYGALDLLRVLRESGYFEGVEPWSVVVRVQVD